MSCPRLKVKLIKTNVNFFPHSDTSDKQLILGNRTSDKHNTYFHSFFFHFYGQFSIFIVFFSHYVFFSKFLVFQCIFQFSYKCNPYTNTVKLEKTKGGPRATPIIDRWSPDHLPINRFAVPIKVNSLKVYNHLYWLCMFSQFKFGNCSLFGRCRS